MRGSRALFQAVFDKKAHRLAALTDLAQADWHIAAVQSHIKRQGFRVEHVLDTGQSSIP